MGIHIIAYKLGNKIHEEVPYSAGDLYTYYEKERLEGWDSLRHTGDSDFIDPDNGLEWERKLEDSSAGDIYKRPANFPQAKQWVRTNVPEGNQSRLLWLLEEMEKDPSLYIYVSY